IVRIAASVAHRDGDLDPLVDRGEEFGLQTAARRSGAGQTLLVDIGPFGEIIQGANAVPNQIGCVISSSEDRLRSGVPVFQGDEPVRAAGIDQRAAENRVEVLPSLALSWRVVYKHDVAAPRQVNPQTLILLERFAHAPVAHRREYGGIGRRPLSGNVYVRRDVIARTAFKDNLLNL